MLRHSTLVSGVAGVVNETDVQVWFRVCGERGRLVVEDSLGIAQTLRENGWALTPP